MHYCPECGACCTCCGDTDDVESTLENDDDCTHPDGDECGEFEDDPEEAWVEC